MRINFLKNMRSHFEMLNKILLPLKDRVCLFSIFEKPVIGITISVAIFGCQPKLYGENRFLVLIIENGHVNGI